MATFLICGTLLVRYFLAYRHEQQLDDSVYAIRQRELEAHNGVDSEDTNRRADGNQATTSFDTILDSELYQMNADYVAFLSIPDTPIFYPVVQRDNDYYLKHDFMMQSNGHGAIFLDEGCDIADDYIMLHGHHMRDKTMFASLDSYKKAEFREGHKLVYLDTGAGDEAYEVFAVAKIDLTPDDFFHYEDFPDNDEERVSYLKKMKSNAMWYTDPDAVADKGAQMLFLSTCSYGTDDQRLVICCVKIEG